jgi:DNA-binding IclR family transcriptional regulator
MPGLGSEIRDSAHALAMGKVVLSLLSPNALARYVARGLTAFTPHTIISPAQLAAELEQVRANGYAVDREEFDENFCCIAAPIFDARGRFLAALGMSMAANIFDAEREQLAPVVVDVAGRATPRELASRYEKRPVLVSGRSPHLASNQDRFAGSGRVR